MENVLWNLFRETGDPMSYLLYKAGEKQEKKKTDETPKAPQDQTPPASY